MWLKLSNKCHVSEKMFELKESLKAALLCFQNVGLDIGIAIGQIDFYKVSQIIWAFESYNYATTLYFSLFFSCLSYIM